MSVVLGLELNFGTSAKNTKKIIMTSIFFGKSQEECKLKIS